MVPSQSSYRLIGTLFIAGSLLLLIPYTMLTIIFEYPDILRQETGTVLQKFHEGGATLILTWWSFAMVGLPLLAAFIMLGEKLEGQHPLVRTATTVGVIGLIVQMIGLLRWSFVVPVLAANYVNGDAVVRQASIAAFQAVHHYGGVVLGEHLGQLFSIGWTVMISAALRSLGLLPSWTYRFGLTASAIYLSAQMELFATVIPGTPFWAAAGFIGSTLWLIWLIVVGILMIRRTSA